jgi:hypothetical protein
MELPRTVVDSDSIGRHLYRQGALRWAGLAVAIILLALLWMLAGRVRQPGAVKRSWAVLASRGLAVAGAFFTARLLLFTGEERIPVLLLAPRDEQEIEAQLGVTAALADAGHEAIPMMDVVRFIRERRYVPRRSFALAVVLRSIEEVGPVVAAAGNLSLTVILPAEAFRSTGDLCSPDLPAHVAVGTTAEGASDPARALRALADASENLLGRRCEYALELAPLSTDLRALVKDAGYVSLLDGRGYNRFGDEAHLIRVMDVSSLVGSRCAVALLKAWISLYKGTYIVWPAIAVGRLFGACEPGSEDADAVSRKSGT